MQWALLAFGVGAVALIVLAVQEPGGQVQRLPDGSTLELRGWTTPPDHVFVDGKLWQQALLRLPWDVPWVGGFRGRHPSQMVLMFDRISMSPPPPPSAPDDLVLWFRHTGGRDPFQNRTLAWIDAHGCRFPTQSGGHAYGTEEVPSESVKAPGNPTSSWQRWKTSATVLPRREAGPHQYALVPENSKQGRKPVATFSVPRPPLPSAYPTWAASPLPVRVADGDTTFALTHVERLPDGTRPFDTYAATFQYSGPNVARQRWRPEQIAVSDATGNQLIEYIPEDAGSKKIPSSALCRQEAAWKLRVRFVPSEPLKTHPDTVWRIRNLKVPPFDEDANPGLSWSEGGIHLRLDTIRQATGRGWHPHSLPHFHVSGTTPFPCLITMSGITDEKGFAQDYYTRSQLVEPGKLDLRFKFGLSEKTQHLNLTFTVHRTPTVEFLVKPP